MRLRHTGVALLAAPSVVLSSSACVTSAVTSYLLTVVLPPAGTQCQADDQPYPTVAG